MLHLIQAISFDVMPACERADMTVCAERDILASEVDGL